jgi:hypothetical protein
MMKYRRYTMKRSMIMLIGFVALVSITLLATTFITGKVSSASGEVRLSHTVKVVEVVGGIHGSIWKFWDNNRECYFNSSGGIWCTP